MSSGTARLQFCENCIRRDPLASVQFSDREIKIVTESKEFVNEMQYVVSELFPEVFW
jgi:hypothetical protein